MDAGATPATSTILILSTRTWTLVGSDALFIALSLVLVLQPALAPYVFPFYGLLFFWSDLRRETELGILFIFLATAAGGYLAARQAGPVRAALVIEIAGLWLLNWAIAALRNRSMRDERDMAVEIVSLSAQIKDGERDVAYYKQYEAAAGGQIRLRRDLADSARHLGAATDATQVHERLVSILAARYPECRVEVSAEAGADPLLQGATGKKGPVLARDASADPRLKGQGYGSALAVPMRVMKQPAGFLKIASAKANALGPEDVRAADLFATMAGLSLENIRFYEQVHQQATHDSLTQLASHKAFQGRLQEELLRAGRSQTPLSLIMCDIDHFKTYNDRYGHQAGDHLLRTVSAILMSFARPVDFVARYGGEEFTLILPSFVRTEAVEVANRIRVRLASEPFVFQGQRTSATMSFGVAAFPQDATTASQIIRVADERLYKAKNGGRNQVCG